MKVYSGPDFRLASKGTDIRRWISTSNDRSSAAPGRDIGKRSKGIANGDTGWTGPEVKW